MAALDFGMAKARGLIAPTSAYETDIIQKAGGRGVFKSEDWWNKQLDAAVESESFKETVTERMPANSFAGRGTFDYKVRRAGYESATPIYEERYIRRGRGRGPQYLPITTPNVDRNRYMVQKYITGYMGTKTKDVTKETLDKITALSKQEASRVRSTVGAEKAARRKLTRGTGGLMAKAKPVSKETIGTATASLGEELKIL
jgi:hypothetical protein